LESLALKESETVVVVSEEWAHSLVCLEKIYEHTISRPEHEGVIVKQWQAPYRSGQDSLGKAKLKPYTSIDAVVLGYRQTSGRPTALLVGVWDRAPYRPDARLMPIALVESAKAGSKSKQWAEIASLIQSLAQPQKPEAVVTDIVPDRWVRPEIVVEIGCDGMRKRDSRFRTLGYTFHDETFLKLREDKSIWDADDVNRFMGLRLAPGET
jgi:ATP-dependent DNA ligase